MPCNNAVVPIDKDRVIEAKFLDARCNLCDLFLGVRARILLVGLESFQVDVLNLREAICHVFFRVLQCAVSFAQESCCQR